MRAAAGGVLAVAALAAGCGKESSQDEPGKGAAAARPAAGSDAPAVAAAQVPIASFKYLPETVTVKVGGTVEWTNRDKAPHTSTAEDSSFDTGTLDTGDVKKQTFAKAGTYRYYCVFHRFMEATVVVK